MTSRIRHPRSGSRSRSAALTGSAAPSRSEAPTGPAVSPSPPWRDAHGVGVSQTVLIACAPFGPRLTADVVTSAIARGLRDGGLPEPDVCPLSTADAASGPGAAITSAGPSGDVGEQDVRGQLDALGFDARMRAARAVVIGVRRLQERALAGSVAFEIATRARQGGISAYAVTGQDSLEPFDARILDLQLVLQAASVKALVAAGCRLAGVV